MGTTAAVASFLASRRLYLMEMQQFDDVLTHRFFVRVVFCGVAGEPLDINRLRQDFLAVANAEQMKVHHMLVIGPRDLEAGNVSVRVHGKGHLGAKKREEVVAEILAAIRERRA